MREKAQWDPLLRSLEVTHRASFYPLGFRLDIETNDPRVLECAESSYGIFGKGHKAGVGFKPAPANAQSQAAALRMRLVRAPEASAVPPWPAPAYRAWGDLFAIVCGPENFLTADLARREAMGFFSPAMLDDREFFRWTFLDCATYVLLVWHHFTPIHAACVVRDGRGICLCGPAGAGKTSLAYACLRAGYQLLGDDVVYLLRSEHQPLLRGNPSRLHFPVSARQLFPELEQIPPAIRRDGNQFLAVRTEQWRPGQSVTQAEAVAVVFLERGKPASLESVEAGVAHRLLFDALPLDDEKTMAEHSRAIERLLQAGAYRLRYSTPEQALQHLNSLALLERVHR